MPPPEPSSPPTPTTNTPSLLPLYTALVLTTPLLALLPPRKLDLYTLSLASLFVYSAQELIYSDTRRQVRIGNTGVMGGQGDDDDEGARLGKGKEGDGEGGMRGLARKVWMGGEKEGWQRRRLEREREELEGGKGYGDIIMGQVREVFPGFGGRGRREDGEEEGEGEG